MSEAAASSFWLILFSIYFRFFWLLVNATPLSLAEAGGHDGVAELLRSETLQAQLNLRLEGGDTVLHQAAAKGDMEKVKALIKVNGWRANFSGT